jgi:hypothetical protein
MGQFKPMVKMETTEPSVILKLKKGGHVAMPKKAVKKMNGGTMGALAAAPSPRTMPVAPAGRAPARPSLAERRRAMMGKKGMAAPMMAKKGGKMESKAEHAKEATKAELKAHANKPASKAHKGLKTGGVVKGQGGYKTGGVVNCKATGGVVKGQGGYKKGGAAKKPVSRQKPVKRAIGGEMAGGANYQQPDTPNALGMAQQQGPIQRIPTQSEIDAVMKQQQIMGSARPPIGGLGSNPQAPRRFSSADALRLARSGDIAEAQAMLKQSVGLPGKLTSADALRYLRQTGNQAGAQDILRRAVGLNPIPMPNPQMPFRGISNMPSQGISDIERKRLQSLNPQMPIPLEFSLISEMQQMQQPMQMPKPSMDMGIPNPYGSFSGLNLPGMQQQPQPTPPSLPTKYAKGGMINSGRPEKMPQGRKSPSAPVSISRLSATFKKGGSVKKADGGQMKPLDAQAAKETKGYEDHYKREAEENRAMREAMNPMNLLRKARDAFKGRGAVTTTEEKVSQTVSPAPQKKRRGGYSKGGRC